MVKLGLWGHSLGLRLNAAICEAADLKPGSYVVVRLLDCGEIRIRPYGRLNPADPEDGKPTPPIDKPTEASW